MKYPTLATMIALVYTGIANAANPVVGSSSPVSVSSNPPMPFEQIDSNHDEMISRDEARIDIQLFKDFDKFNVSHTGMLDRGEYQVYAQYRQSPGKY